MRLSDKQVRALRACAEPGSDQAHAFWMEARSRTHGRPNWPGLRKTLGSLYARGLVTYTDPGRWGITDAGREALAEVQS